MKITKIENEEDLRQLHNEDMARQQRKVYKYWLLSEALMEVFLNKRQITELKKHLEKHHSLDGKEININLGGIVKLVDVFKEGSFIKGGINPGPPTPRPTEAPPRMNPENEITMFEYAIEVLEEKIKTIRFNISKKIGSTDFYTNNYSDKDIKELKAAIELLMKAGGNG